MSSNRVVSMLPSAAEMIALCGGESMLVARGHEDDFPHSITSLPIVTGANTVFTSSADVDVQVSQAVAQGNALYTIDAETLKKVQPTHIVTQDLCHVCAIDLQTVERIAKQMDPKPEIVTLNPLTFQDVLDDITRIGVGLGLEKQASEALGKLNERVTAARAKADTYLEKNGGLRKRCLFVEWTDPVYPGGHWTPQLMYMAGGEQRIAPATDTVGAGPSARVTHEACIASDPEIIVISPCGLNLKEARRETDLIKDKEWFKTLCKPGVRVCLVDGNQMFNRPGPRLVDALEFLVGYLWEDDSLIPADFPWERYI
ncbi:hypothetical protein HDU79_008940 [Rhizoclosmatium sp. JEL0117]|nr:hypothetical protein HDU79_008940 [Rhizoclosmatium sp. JEL0117]